MKVDTDAKTFDELSVEEVKLLLQQPLVVAVGECGLHFDHNFTSRKSAAPCLS
jgi:TatD DNase family protein